jgi:hypothetical protein
MMELGYPTLVLVNVTRFELIHVPSIIGLKLLNRTVVEILSHGISILNFEYAFRFIIYQCFKIN